MTTAVLYYADDARRFLAERPVDAALPLTPVARAALAEAGIEALDPRARFGDEVQARCVARAVAARTRVLRALAGHAGDSPVLREIATDHVNRVAFSSLRLWETLGEVGPWLVPGERWAEAGTREDAHALLLDHVLSSKVAGEERVARVVPPPLALYRLLRRFVLACRRDRGATLLVGTGDEQFGVYDALTRADPPARAVLLHFPRRGLGEYAKLARELFRAATGASMIQLPILAAPGAPARALAERCVGAVEDAVIARALSVYSDLMAYRFGVALAARGDALAVVRALRAEAYVAVEVSSLENWLVAEACGRAGTRRIVLSRNANAPAANDLERDSARGYLRARYPEGLVDEYLFWSPLGAAAARQVLPRAAWPAIRPLRALDVAPAEAPREAAREALVVLADTAAVWWFPHAWVFQTTDEYIDGVRSLARALGGLARVRLLVRAKNKPEADLESIVRLVDPPANCEIKIRDVPFRDDLARADLVVSFRSTTVEEALHARKPVLLWGGTARYRYLPARTTPPSADDRAAVYAVARTDELAPMIEAIVAAHAGRPLTDDEIAEYVWPAQTADIAELAAALAAPANVPLREREERRVDAT